MAVINNKKLLQHYAWSKLSPSARILLEQFAKCTDKNGIGSPSWGGLMRFSGIVGKDTFKKSRQQLLDMGLISMIKTWSIVDKDGKKIPRATVTYQITESILWNKSPSNQYKQSNLPHIQSMNMGSMSFGKEGVSSLGVNKERDVYKQPSAVNEPIKERVNRGGGEPTAIGETLVRGYSGLVGHSGISENKFVPRYEWQVEAERLAKFVGIRNPSRSWFKFFRDSFAKNRKFLLQRAASSMVDAPDIKDKEKYFFGLVGKFLKE